MILINTGIDKEKLNECIEKIETEDFFPASISQYRTFVYENLSKDKLPSLEYYRYKLSRDSLDLLFSIKKNDKPTYRDGELTIQDLDIPNLEFSYAHRHVEDIIFTEDLKDAQEEKSINLPNFEENSFTNSENSGIVIDEVEAQNHSEDKPQDIVDDFLNIGKGYQKHNDGFTTINDLIESKEELKNRDTATWNNMASKQTRSSKPQQNLNEDKKSSGESASVDFSTLFAEFSSVNKRESNIPTKGVLQQETKPVVLQDTGETYIEKISVTTENKQPNSNQSVVTPSPFVLKDLRQFLREYPNSEIDFVLKYFSKKEIERALKLGKIMKKGTKLHI